MKNPQNSKQAKHQKQSISEEGKKKKKNSKNKNRPLKTLADTERILPL